MIKLNRLHQSKKQFHQILKYTTVSKRQVNQRKIKNAVRYMSAKVPIMQQQFNIFGQIKKYINLNNDSFKSFTARNPVAYRIVSGSALVFGAWGLYTFFVDMLKKVQMDNKLTKSEEAAIENILNSLIDSSMEDSNGKSNDEIKGQKYQSSKASKLSNSRFKPVTNVTATFDDIQGCDGAKQDLEDLISFLKEPKRFNDIGATLPKGIILVGPPGVGKTSLAKAVAGEAKVPFIYASASEFDEMYVGVGALRVRELFETAKAYAPCVVFLDELDAVGSKRINNPFRSSQNQTISQLLAELDGFQSTNGIIVLGATNNKEALDKALIRPGRFDMEVEVLPPDYDGRKALFQLYLGKMKAESNIDFEQLAKGSVGFTGASIKNMVNQSAILAGLNHESSVHMSHLWKARDRLIMGSARKKLSDEETNRITAFHEAGHAIAAFFTEDSEPIHKVTIIPRNHSLGHTSFLADKERHNWTKAQLEAKIDSLMAGKIAEEMTYGLDKVTTGASDDLKKATAIASNMVMNLGMSDHLAYRTFPLNQDGSQDSMLSASTKLQIDKEVEKILKNSYERVRELLSKNEEKLKSLAETLLQHETLDNKQISEILSPKVSGSSNPPNAFLGGYKHWISNSSKTEFSRIDKE